MNNHKINNKIKNNKKQKILNLHFYKINNKIVNNKTQI